MKLDRLYKISVVLFIFGILGIGFGIGANVGYNDGVNGMIKAIQITEHQKLEYQTKPQIYIEGNNLELPSNYQLTIYEDLNKRLHIELSKKDWGSWRIGGDIQNYRVNIYYWNFTGEPQ